MFPCVTSQTHLSRDADLGHIGKVLYWYKGLKRSFICVFHLLRRRLDRVACVLRSSWRLYLLNRDPGQDLREEAPSVLPREARRGTPSARIPIRRAEAGRPGRSLSVETPGTGGLRAPDRSCCIRTRALSFLGVACADVFPSSRRGHRHDKIP